MSNKLTDPELELGKNTEEVDPSSRGVSPIVCPKCAAEKIAHSRRQRFDDLKMRFIAKRPYRCLHCYHRFWVAEKFTASSKRVWTLVILLLFVILALLKFISQFSTPEPMQRISIVVPESRARANEDDTPPSLASLINMPQEVGANDTSIAPNSPEVFDTSGDDSLSPEQKARQLLLAKQQAEVAEKVSQARVEQLEQVLLPADDELESLVKVEVGYVIERWREAWSKGDIDSYLLSYSSNFVPANGLELDRWIASRKTRVTPEKQIDIVLSNFDVSMLEELSKSVIEFNQRYQSGSYIESSRKRLNLVKEDGSWKITSEVELK